jgi:hypothetical protein
MSRSVNILYLQYKINIACRRKLMKKQALAIALAALLAFGVVAPSAALKPLMASGDLAVTAGVGYGFLWGAIDVSGGAEYMLGQFTVADILPFTYGVAAKASFYSWNGGLGTDYIESYLGGGVFGTLHFGLKDLDLPEQISFLANVDTYIGLGAGFFSRSFGYSSSKASDFKVGLRGTGGASYFITPKIAVTTEGGYYGGYSSGLVGLLFKL